MSNEETIYECTNDNTRWYGSNQVPEVCPTCGEKGNISVPQDFDSSAEKDAAIEAVEPVIEAAPVADEAPVEVAEETPAFEVPEVNTDATSTATVEVTPDAEVVEPVITEELPA